MPELTLIEAIADIDDPPRSWPELVSAANLMAAELFGSGTICLRAVSELEMRLLNSRYRQVDATTDVLSFPAGPAAERGHIGDIALCYQRALGQAKANGNSVLEEAAALVAHGLLHLAGYNHDSIEADAYMTSLTIDLCHKAGYTVRRFGH